MGDESVEIGKTEVLEMRAEPEADIASGRYEQYRALGGVFSREDYDKVLARARETTTVDKRQIAQAEIMVSRAGIELAVGEVPDPIVVLYGVLRSGNEVGQGKMSDQELFVEVLRMLGKEGSLGKFVERLPRYLRLQLGSSSTEER